MVVPNVSAFPVIPRPAVVRVVTRFRELSVMPWRLIGWLLVVSLVPPLGCVSRQPEKPGEAVGFEKVPAGELPRFSDDIDSASLKEAIQRSLLFYGKIPEDRVFKLGDREVRVRLLKETLHCFLELLNSGEVNAGNDRPVL